MNVKPAKRIEELDTSAIRKAFELAKSIKNPINLSIGQPHFPCPKNIIDKAKLALDENKTAYTLTSGLPELKNALAEKYRTFNKIQYATPERILITSGVSSSLLLLFNALVDPGDEILIVSPYFLMYPAYSKMMSAKITTIPEDFNIDEIQKLNGKKFKFIIFSTPSNPTGKILDKNQLSLLVDLAENTGAYIVSDEIYELFDYDRKFISVGSFYEKTITLSGFSKSYSMTGLRLSSILADIEIIELLTKLQQYTIVCAPSISQWAGIEALKTDITEFIDDYRLKRDYVFDSLKNHYEIKKSDGAFYYFIKINEVDEEFCKRAIFEKKLIIVPGYIFTESKNYIRISFATDWDNLKKGISALVELSS